MLPYLPSRSHPSRPFAAHNSLLAVPHRAVHPCYDDRMDQVITPAIWCDGTADEAAQFYADVFRDTSIAEQAPGLAATVSIHDFTFTPGVSIIVSCRDQEEIDRYWAGLSAVPEVERCGWCIDRWGVSWQVVPYNIAELMADAATRDKILHMGKIDLAKL